MPTINSPQSLVLVDKQNGLVVIPAATPLTRLNYFDGKFLRAQDLKVEQDYLRQLVRQSNQAGGPGVAHGFDLTAGAGDTLNIGQGLAIDPQGRVLLLPQPISVGAQELIDKSRDLQRLFGKSAGVGDGEFDACELHSDEPPVDVHEQGNLFLIVISSAEAYCGEEDVYGKLCEEACATSTDRPYLIEGLTVRAVPLVLRTPLPNPRARSLTQIHFRSRVASAYFEDERKRVASLISKFGLEQETWCLGAAGAGGSGVAIGVLARVGSVTVFLDPWIARRERIDTPAKRYWQWRMMMRPWDVFIAQVLQFQCQLHDLFRRTPVPGGEVDPCGGARGVINEAATTIADLKQFYESTTQRFTALRVNLEEAITFQGGLTRLTDLNQKLVNIGRTLAEMPQDEFLIRGGIIELPSAGYLPVTPGANATVNQQVRRLMGGGVDLRFCVVRPDYVAHALEEAQHMERISLVQGLDDPEHKPQVDILVPNGEVLEQKLLSPGTGFEASVDLNALFLSGPDDSANTTVTREPQPLNLRGAARIEKLLTGGGAFYLSCEHQQNIFNALAVAASTIQPAPTTAATTAGATGTANTATTAAATPVLADAINFNRTAIFLPPRFGLWVSLRCDSNVFALSRGDTANINASATLVGSNSPTPFLDVQFNGLIQITQPTRTNGAAKTLAGRIQNAQLSFSGVRFAASGAKTNVLVDLDVTATLTGGSAVEIVLSRGSLEIVLKADWSGQPLKISATILEQIVFKSAGLSATAGEFPISRRIALAETLGADPTVNRSGAILAHADLRENADVLSDKNALHAQALGALELIAKVINDVTFADAKGRLLFPPPPKPTDELIVRGTMDWVMFHRRRTKRCSQEICVPPVAPARQYQVYHLALGSVQEVQPTREKLIGGSIPESAFNKLPLVDYAGGIATLLTDPQAWRADWANIQPGNSIVYGGIANRDSAAADGDTLALSRLSRLVDAVAPVSTPNSQMTSELLNQIPSSIPASSVDGIIFLFTIKAADLKITKTGTEMITIDGNITYTITVTNTGPEAAQNVTVTDDTPSSTTFISARGLGAAATEWAVTQPTPGQTGTVVFSKASVASGETATFEIVVHGRDNPVNPPVAITNTAVVASATGDPNAANNTATVITPVMGRLSADLQITKTAALGNDAAGRRIITYTLTATNAGPSTAQSVTVTDAVPANTTFVSADGPAGWTQSDQATINALGIVSFMKPSVAKGESATFQIVVRVNVNLAGPPITVINNTARVESMNPDPNTSNNQATTTTDVTPPAAIRTALVVFADVSNARFPIPNTQRTKVIFTNNVPDAVTLDQALQGKPPGISLARFGRITIADVIAPLDPDINVRLSAVVTAYKNAGGLPNPATLAMVLNAVDKQALLTASIDLTGIDEVIYVELGSIGLPT
jgi:uncharacterized repeat protein (TIGR01451 family)